MAKNSSTFRTDDGRPKGRPRGKQNKVTVKAKEAFLTVMELLEHRMTTGDDIINRLSPSKAAELYLGLLNYVKPKLTKNDNNNENSGELVIKVEYSDAVPNNNSDERRPE